MTKILCLIRINDDKKYEIVEHLESGDDCIVVLNQTNFYSEKGGQKADNGVLSLTKDPNLKIIISDVQHLQDYAFHFGEIKIENDSSAYLQVKKNDYCYSKIDGNKRYMTTLSHTGVHVLNDAVRRFYKNEDSIIQVMSSAREDNFKFEFLFNKISKFVKPTFEDIEQIENECNKTIDQELPIFESETDYEIIEKGVNNVRKLRDILYPKRVRVVSVGQRIDDNVNTSNFHELCCGTHASNTKDLKKIAITGINSNGDFTYEIEACVGKHAAEVERNEVIIDDIYQEIRDTDANTMHGLHEVSRKCTEIELLTQYWKLSYPFRLKLQKNLEKYRPSKFQLQKSLRSYFHEQIIGLEKIDAVDLNLKFIKFNSILNSDQSIQALTKVSRLPSSLLAFNQYRNYLIVYSYKDNGCEEEYEKLFNLIENFLINNKIAYEKVQHLVHKNVTVFKIPKEVKPQKIIDLCKNIEKI